jgi:regulator of sigma E protease
MSWLIVFAGLCTLIVLHEAGHFFAAKATGMRVERFFLFFGPTIWSFKRGETEYGIKSIPLGGYVKITGMNPEEEMPPEVAHRAYYRQPVWKRIVVIGAGPGVNILLGLVILFFVTLTSAVAGDQTVHSVTPKTPAQGVLKPGDKILAVDGSAYPKLDPDERISRFREEIGSHHCPGNQQKNGCRAETPVRLTIERDGLVRQVSVRPEYQAKYGQTLVGFSFDERPVDVSAGEAVDRSTGFAWLITHETVSRFARIFNSKERKEISGIVGVSDVGQQTVGLGAAAALTFLAVISLSLGLINLFPFLPLDGGHIFWSLVEKVRGGRQVSLATMEKASVVGIILVVMLAAIGLSNDIGRLTGEGFNVR